MKWWPERGVWERQLLAWSIRGVFCAGPSYCWAMAAGFHHPIEVVAMLAGVATYVLAYAWATALPVYRERVETREIGWSLRFAANTRAAIAPLMVFGPDMWLGALSMAIMQPGARIFGVVNISQADSFVWTYATTLVQGGLVSVTMFVLALVVWAIRALWQRRQRGAGAGVVAS